jgi:DNA processing protein
MTNTEAAIILNMLPQVGPVRVRRLTERFGSPVAILEAPGASLRSVEGIGPEVSSVITSWKENTDLDAELALIEQTGARVLTQSDTEYPNQICFLID